MPRCINRLAKSLFYVNITLFLTVAPLDLVFSQGSVQRVYKNPASLERVMKSSLLGLLGVVAGMYLGWSAHEHYEKGNLLNYVGQMSFVFVIAFLGLTAFYALGYKMRKQ